MSTAVGWVTDVGVVYTPAIDREQTCERECSVRFLLPAAGHPCVSVRATVFVDLNLCHLGV